MFEINNNIEHFILSNNNLEKSLAVFTRRCYCPSGDYVINTGCIKGQKLSNEEWQIDINIAVVTELTEIFMISQIFKVAEK